MSQPTTIDCIFEHILSFMLPFFLAAAGGDKALARAVISELAEAYNAATAIELELVGRILGFSTVAMDNLRVSMDPEMSDTKVLRYRSNAIALSRAGNNAGRSWRRSRRSGERRRNPGPCRSRRSRPRPSQGWSRSQRRQSTALQPQG